MYAIEARNISKIYQNGVKALEDISIKVKAGEIFCLLGENGAGKSTLINILSTSYTPTSGEIKIFEQSLTKQNVNQLRQKVATVSQQVSIDTYLSLKENMLFQADLYRIPKSIAIKRMNELIQQFGLQKYLNYPVSSFSGGIKRRLDIALNLMSNPEILFLDEPTVGMDIQSRKEMWKMIQHIKDKLQTTIFLTTHYLEEAEELSDSICIMKNGQIIVQEATQIIKNYFQENAIEITFSSNQETNDSFELFSKHFNNDCCRVSLKQNSIIIYHGKENGLYTFLDFILKHQITIKSVSIVQPKLADIFTKIIEKGISR